MYTQIKDKYNLKQKCSSLGEIPLKPRLEFLQRACVQPSERCEPLDIMRAKWRGDPWNPLDITDTWYRSRAISETCIQGGFFAYVIHRGKNSVVERRRLIFIQSEHKPCKSFGHSLSSELRNTRFAKKVKASISMWNRSSSNTQQSTVLHTN